MSASIYKTHARRNFATYERLENRDLLSTDVQLLPLHGAFCHCTGCASVTKQPATQMPLNMRSVNASVTRSVQSLTTAFAIDNTTRVDFVPRATAAAPGYLADVGRSYGNRGNGLTYGWRRDNGLSHFQRNSALSPDTRYDTTARMSSTAAWEIKVPNGWYDVSIYLGDADRAGADLRMNVEGKLAARVKLHYADKRFGEGHIKVRVTDGRLTLATATGAQNNSIAFMEYTPIGTPIASPYSNNIKWTKNYSIKSPLARVEAGTVRVGNKMYVMGGYTNGYLDVSGRVDIYNINTNVWSRGANLPGTQTHAGVASDGQYIYWVGGQYGALFNRVGSNESWRYDIANDLWQPYVNLPEVRFGGGLAFTDGNLYFFGGALADRSTASANAWKLQLNPADTVTQVTQEVTKEVTREVVDETTGEITTVITTETVTETTTVTTPTAPDWTPVADMPKAADHLGHAVVNGQVYAIGGEHDHGNSYIQHDDVFSYDPAANAWTRRASMPTASSHFEGNVVEYQNKLYVFGGQIIAQQLTNEVRSYDPSTNTWTRHTNMPELRKGGVSWFNNGRFHYLTGDAHGRGQPLYSLVGEIF